ncbi:MAG: amidase [Saprospiraceae bacterium]|nr:amidase [Saprospiraceae bacterium]
MKRRQFVHSAGWSILYLSNVSLLSCEGENSAMALDLQEVDIMTMHSKYKDGIWRIPNIVQWYIQRIKAIDENGPQLNSVLCLNPDAMEIAEALQTELEEGKVRGALHGIPVLLKDNIDTQDKMPTTAGSRALKDSIALKDSPLAAQLREAGAVILGKANLSEWANFRADFSSSGWSGLGGQTKNPYDLSRNPCGSSAGSGASVSANLCMFAIGTETNGSIVCPSNANGIVGIKPTVGLISRSGIIPISFTQDTAGPMTRTVSDAAITLGFMTAQDSNDSKTVVEGRKALTDYTTFLKKDGLAGKRIGIYNPSRDFHHRVENVFNAAIQTMEDAGATLIELDKISTVRVGGDSYNVLLYEFKDGLNKYFKSLGPNAPVKSLEELIAFNAQDSIELKYFDQDILQQAQDKGDLNSEEYVESLERMLKHTREEGIDKVMASNQLDAIVAPTGSPAWKTDLVNGDRFLGGSSSPAAQSGYPAITCPMGIVEGLPVGISFFGQAWTEGKLIEMAYAFEQITKVRFAPNL